MCLVGLYLDGGFHTHCHRLCGVVLLERRGIGIAYDRIEVTVITSALMMSVWRVCSYQSKHARPLPVLPRGHVGGEVMRVPHGQGRRRGRG
jgi:hypothetical protein